MTDAPKIRFVYPGGDRFATILQAAGRQPSWPMRVAAITFLIVVGIPIMLLLLLAAIVATTVFAVLVGINRVLGLFGGRSSTLGSGDSPAGDATPFQSPPSVRVFGGSTAAGKIRRHF